MATSGTYTFGSLLQEQIITDAYERIGILPDLLTAQQIVSAARSINFLFVSWLNRGLNLWTVRQEMLSLVPNQATYTLPSETQDLLDVTLRTSNRNLGGTPFSSAGGVAANAFDGNSSTACTQTAPNGYISYQWGNQFGIQLVGIQSNVTTTYTLALEYSNDGIDWFVVRLLSAQTFTAGTNVWFTIPIPTLGTYFRVRETGGATLNIQELYFNSNLNDTVVTRISRSEYIALPQKNQTGRPSNYYIDRQINPFVTLWPVPDTNYNNLFYTRNISIQDAGQLTNNLDIPRRFFEAITAELSYRLALKKPDLDLNKIQALKEVAEKEFDLATHEDTEKVPLRIYGDFMQGWTQV